MDRKFDVLILGAGASGLMAAAWLNANSDLKVGVIEGNSSAAAKLKISGGGKCNITNTQVNASHFLGDESFVRPILEQFSKEDLLRWLAKEGLQPVIRKKRYYFCSRSSDEIISILRRQSARSQFFFDRKIVAVEKTDLFSVKTDREVFTAKQLIVATGGISFKSLGASDIGLGIAQAFEHSIKAFQPALVGLTLQPDQFWMKELSGISLKVRIRIGDKEAEEDMLFAHRGISGPAVLSASLYWNKGQISIDFLPGKEILTLCSGQKKQLSTVMNLSKRFSKLFLQEIGIEDKPCNKLTQEEKQRLSLLHNYVFAPSGTFGFTKAEVSKGGVLSEGLQSHCESRSTEGLYFIGEVVDVTGELGGYNFQWAFSSAVAASANIILQVTK